MLSAAEHAQRFLADRGLSLEDVSNCVGEIPDSAALIFGGSVCEGLANDYSDLDLLLVGDADLIRDEVALPVFEAGGATIAFRSDLASLRVQIERVGADHLEQLAVRMQETVESFHHPDEARRVLFFGELDVRTFHRIRTGICLRHAEVAARWRTRLACDFLPTYALATMVAQHANLLEDALGEARAGRRESALWNLKYALGFAAGALLASCGETNPNAKWFVRLLQMNRERAGAELADALVSRMTRAPGARAEEDLDEAIRLCERTIATAVSRDPVVQSRRRTMLARARQAGVALPGMARPR